MRGVCGVCGAHRKVFFSDGLSQAQQGDVHSFPSLYKQINAVPQETKKKDRIKLSLNRRDIIKLRYPDVS